MKILVTGGAGFIGSHITDAYLEMGHEVAVVDDLSTGDIRNVSTKASFYQTPIQHSNLETAFREFSPEIVNHHAAHINLRQSVENPIGDAESNVIGTLNILQLAKKYGSKKIIFASTGGAIYGETDVIPVDETAPAIPLSPYGAGKLAIEHYIRIWHLLHGIDYTIFRYPNVYGPRQNPKGEAGVVAVFALQILGGVTPTIFGDGTKTRDYLYVGDLVRANQLALTQGSCETFNLGWGLEISDQHVFDTISKAMDFLSEPVYSCPRPGEVNRIALDAKRAGFMLGWGPEIGFEEGVNRAVQFYRETAEDNAKD
jgi:UDP-glucose 4-epimerase